MKSPELLAKILQLVKEEFIRASNKNGAFHSMHEGYAVILEELDEVWEVVKNQGLYTPEALKNEAIQVAAMAIRLVFDFCKESPSLKEDISK